MNNAITETIIPTKPNQINFIWLPTQLNKILRVLISHPSSKILCHPTQVSQIKFIVLSTTQPKSHSVKDITHPSVRLLFYPTQILS